MAFITKTIKKGWREVRVREPDFYGLTEITYKAWGVLILNKLIDLRRDTHPAGVYRVVTIQMAGLTIYRQIDQLDCPP